MDERSERRALRSIVAAMGISSINLSTWVPFLALFLLQVGAHDETEAAFWLAVAMGVQGVGRLVAGPLWGLVSDRVGRKRMFVRALFFSALSTLSAGLIQAPWQLCIALGLHGLLSGVVPAGTALLSVSVRDSRMKSALSRLSSVQYVGLALGPSLGALLAWILGYRGTFFVAAIVTVAIGFLVLRTVPQDDTPVRPADGSAPLALPRFRLSGQLALSIFVMFILFALYQLRQMAAPIGLLRIEGGPGGNVAALTGIAFTLSAVTSAAGVLIVARRFQNMPLRKILVAGCTLAAASHLLLALSSSAASFIAAFALCSLLHAAMFPIANTLIALNADRERRGTAFGLATGIQALGLVAGPMAGAVFTATSLALGFALVGGTLLALALLLQVKLREPRAA